MTNHQPMGFSDHDMQLLVWGVVNVDQAAAEVQVRAHRDHDTAAAAADAAGPITVTVAYTFGSAPAAIRCSRLVYHHVEHGWTFAAIGHRVPTEIAAYPVTSSPAQP